MDNGAHGLLVFLDVQGLSSVRSHPALLEQGRGLTADGREESYFSSVIATELQLSAVCLGHRRVTLLWTRDRPFPKTILCPRSICNKTPVSWNSPGVQVPMPSHLSPPRWHYFAKGGSKAVGREKLLCRYGYHAPPPTEARAIWGQNHNDTTWSKVSTLVMVRWLVSG